MRYIVVADIHSNLEALEQVIPFLESADIMLCLGDIIGYGPNPSECLSLIQQTTNVSIAGNHDLAAVDKVSLSKFNLEARKSIVWTKKQLSSHDISFIGSLSPEKWVGEDILLTHGSPRDPLWEYLLFSQDANTIFDQYDFWICFVGHTHTAMVFQRPFTGSCEIKKPTPNALREINRETRYIINVGSVGQSRDGDPRASFAVLDDDRDTLEFFRINYPVKKTQGKMEKAGLPQFLIDRLVLGI